MKNITISLITLLALSSQSHAGREFLPVIITENEQVEVKLEPIKELKEESGWYIGIGLVAGKAEAVGHKDYTYGAMVKLGYDINEYVAVEARALKTNWDYDGDKVEHVGVFLKPKISISDNVALYGLVGYANTALGEHNAFSDTGLAYGAGVDYALNEDFGIFVDYERLLHDAGAYDLDALSLGTSFKF